MTAVNPPPPVDEPAPLGVSDAEWAEFNHRNGMTRLRRYAERHWPYGRLFPSDEPIYVTKLFYLFGALALAAFASLIVTGMILAFKGPLWWRGSSWGNFFNALHFWSVQVFFVAIFVHSAASFFTAAWRGGRGLTWVWGVLTFLVAVLTGLTGYTVQSNYAAQYIGQQAKDALNPTGLGYVLNVMSFDNSIGWHMVLLPLLVALLVVAHLLWVRRHGVVAPFPPDGFTWQGAADPRRPTAAERGSSTRAGRREGRS